MQNVCSITETRRVITFSSLSTAWLQEIPFHQCEDSKAENLMRNSVGDPNTLQKKILARFSSHGSFFCVLIVFFYSYTQNRVKCIKCYFCKYNNSYTCLCFFSVGLRSSLIEIARNERYALLKLRRWNIIHFMGTLKHFC